MDVDPKYEYNAPQFVDFTRMDEEDDGVDIYFDKHHEHEHDLHFSPKASTEILAEDGVEKKASRILRSAVKSAKPNITSSPALQMQPEPSEKVPSNLCTSLSKWRSTSAQVVQPPIKKKDTSRRSTRLMAVRNDGTTAKSNSGSEEVPAKRRCLNVVGVDDRSTVPCKTASSNVKTLVPCHGTDLDKFKRSQAAKDAASKMYKASSMESVVTKTIQQALPHSSLSRSGSMRAVQRMDSKSVRLPRSLDASHASIAVSEPSNTTLNTKSATKPQRKLRLTLPETPDIMKRRAKMIAASDRMKSTEELELEKISQFKKDLSKKIEVNMESCRAALAGRKPEPVLASKPATKPEEFHFETDSRIKDHTLPAYGRAQEGGFPAMLRKNDAPMKAAHHGVTQPKPFNLHADRKRKFDAEEDERPGFKFETMAEKLWKFSSKTPERFRMKHSDKVLRTIAESPHLTVAKTPKLETRTRARPTHILSQKDIEEMEIEEMKKNQFKAQPINKDRLTHPGVGVKVVRSKPTTVPEPFSLSSDSRHNDMAAHVEEETYSFHANPVPKGILEGVVGVKPAKKLPLTVAQSPAFHLRKSSRLLSKNYEEEQNKPVLSHPMPEFSEPFKPQLAHAVTQVKPFSFEKRTREMYRHKEEQISKILQEEEEARRFYANPMPDLSSVDLPDKQPVNVTMPAPFDLISDARGEEKARRWREKLEEEERRKREVASFRARPPSVLQQLPFEPQRNSRHIESEPFDLSTEHRAEQRGEFERWRVEKEQAAEVERMYRERERLAAEEKEIQRIRAEAVHRANPIRHYKPPPPRQLMTLTAPQSPKFSDRLRSRSLAK